MGKQIATAQPRPAQAIQTVAVPVPLSTVQSAPTWLWWALLAAFTGLYYFWATRSAGFYQQDEAGHFLGMLDFWNDPKSILGNWAKWGYKLLFVLTAKAGGLPLVRLQNCLFAAGAAVLSGLALQKQGYRLAAVAAVLVALQPLYISLAFRNYSEVPTAFLVALGYYLHTIKRPALSILCISYICTIRQEFYPILALYGLDMIYRKQWLAVAVAGLFPLLQNAYGYYFFGDPLYLVHQIMGQAGAIADAYPRQGFQHYFELSMVIFGPVVAVLTVHYLVWQTISKRWPDMYLAVPALLFFLMQCLFNWQSVSIGPSTGGNLRYMLVISPLLGMMAAKGLEQFVSEDKKIKALYYLVPLVAVTAIFLGYKSDLLQLTEERDGAVTVGAIAAIGLLFWPLFGSAKSWAVAGAMAFLALLMVRPIKLSEEDEACKQLAGWYTRNEQIFKGKPMFLNHAMFYYFLGRTQADFTPKPSLLTGADAVEKAPIGTVIFWDSHFSYRPKLNPKAINYDYFTARPTEYRLTNQIVTPSQNFGVFVFEKI